MSKRMARAAAKDFASLLLGYRAKHGLNKTQMVDLLKRRGLPGINWSTYDSWERRRVTARPVYMAAALRALARRPPKR